MFTGLREDRALDCSTAAETRTHEPREPPPLQCVQHAGEVLFVPSLWSHAVLNEAKGLTTSPWGCVVGVECSPCKLGISTIHSCIGVCGPGSQHKSTTTLISSRSRSQSSNVPPYHTPPKTFANAHLAAQSHLAQKLLLHPILLCNQW